MAGILCCAGGAYAAEDAATRREHQHGNSLDEIVVTASAQGVKKLDASYNIVSLSLEQIENANPASAAEIYQTLAGHLAGSIRRTNRRQY